MNKKRIGILFIVLGIIIVIASSVVFITKSNDSQNNNNDNSENKENENPKDKDNEENKDNDDNNDEENNNGNNEDDDKDDNNDNENEPTDDEQKNSVCLTDYHNASFKKSTAKINNKTVEIDVLSCMTEQEITENKVKFFSPKDNTYYFEISILDGDKTKYVENLKTKYETEQLKENYNISTTNDYTFTSDTKYSIVNVFKTKPNENSNIIYNDYNFIGNTIDSKIVHIRLVSTENNLEADFISLVEGSLEIK